MARELLSLENDYEAWAMTMPPDISNFKQWEIQVHNGQEHRPDLGETYHVKRLSCYVLKDVARKYTYDYLLTDDRNINVGEEINHREV